MSASQLTPMQLAAEVARRHDGRRDTTVMTNAEREKAGLMTRREAAAHERLAQLPHVRLAERVKGPQADDIWASGGEPDAG